MEKIVKRSELYSPEPSPSNTDSPKHPIKIPMEFLPLPIAKSSQTEQEQEEQQQEEELPFHLFAPPPLHTQTSQPIPKIRLRSPVPNSNPGFEIPYRDKRYYFTDPPTPAEKQRFHSTAVSGKDVLARSSSFRPGSAYAWKVQHILLSSVTRRQALELAEANAVYDIREGDLPAMTIRRKRPGKQARILARRRVVLARSVEEEERKAREAREVREREKKRRRNREKTVKRRLKERERRNGGAGVEKAGPDGGEEEKAGEDDDVSSQPG